MKQSNVLTNAHRVIKPQASRLKRPNQSHMSAHAKARRVSWKDKRDAAQVLLMDADRDAERLLRGMSVPLPSFSKSRISVRRTEEIVAGSDQALLNLAHQQNAQEARISRQRNFQASQAQDSPFTDASASSRKRGRTRCSSQTGSPQNRWLRRGLFRGSSKTAVATASRGLSQDPGSSEIAECGSPLQSPRPGVSRSTEEERKKEARHTIQEHEKTSGQPSTEPSALPSARASVQHLEPPVGVQAEQEAVSVRSEKKRRGARVVSAARRCRSKVRQVVGNLGTALKMAFTIDACLSGKF